MEGVPADIGNWGVLKIFLEGGRLMTQRICLVLPVFVFFFFPACFIHLFSTQFLHDSTPGSLFPSPRSIWTTIWIPAVDVTPQLFMILGAAVLSNYLTTTSYSDCQDGSYPTKSIFTSMKQVLLTRNRVQTENPEDPLGENFNETSEGKKGRACALAFGCWFMFIVIWTCGSEFTPEAVAERGLPPWTALLFTLLIALLLTAIVAYFAFVTFVVYLWLCYPTGGKSSSSCGAIPNV